MKKKLLNLLEAKNKRKAEIVSQADKCEQVEALKALNRELDAINEELRSLQEMIDGMPDDDDGQAQRTLAVNAQVPAVVTAGVTEVRKVDDDMEYRKAFQQYVTKGTPIPAELRTGNPTDESTLTTDVGSAIPTVLVNRIVEKLESTGMILPLVNKTSFAAGVKIPTTSIKPVATWVGEGEGSLKQKQETLAIAFTNFKLRCEISMSMEVATMAISAFENVFVKQVAEAMVKAIEKAILSGNGTTQPKGILTETPATGQALQAAKVDYDLLVDAEAKLPQAYENGAVWCMTKKTFMYFFGMTDAEGQPIARINYGIGGKPERYLLGRSVVLCGDYMDSFSATLITGTVFAFLFNFSDYTINTVYNMGIQRKQDWDTEDMLTKAVMSVDGKVVDTNSLVTIKKKA